MGGEEAERWGFYNRLVTPESVLADATELAASLAHGPSASHAVTKRCLHEEWAMDIDRAIDFEAERQAECMRGEDFERAHRAFVKKETPVFEGN